MNVLSLFDGMSCGHIALRELGIEPDNYYASEIDKCAIKVTQHNFPDTIQLGDVRNIDVSKLPQIDLLIGGSPCQSFSIAGRRNGMTTIEHEHVTTLDRYLPLKQEGFEFEGQSYLFWEYIRILRDVRKNNPNVKFLLENVEMAANWERVLNHAVGMVGVHINSSLVSAQNRKRIYWSNIKTRQYDLFGAQITDIPLPEDRGIVLKDVLEDDVDEKYFLSDSMIGWLYKHAEKLGDKVPIINPNGKSKCLSSASFKMNLTSNFIASSSNRIRRLTPTECARLQTIPDWYSWEHISDTQQYKLLANGWTVEVIKHILSFLKLPSNEQ